MNPTVKIKRCFKAVLVSGLLIGTCLYGGCIALTSQESSTAGTVLNSIFSEALAAILPIAAAQGQTAATNAIDSWVQSGKLSTSQGNALKIALSDWVTTITESSTKDVTPGNYNWTSDKARNFILERAITIAQK